MENIIDSCSQANRDYQKLKFKTPENELTIIDWRVKYFSIYEFVSAQELDNEEAILFIQHFDNSIDYFTKLVMKKEADNLDERVYIMYYLEDEDPNLLAMLCTARSPSKKEGSNYILWEQSLKNENYNSFYIDIELANFYLPEFDSYIDKHIDVILIDGDGKAFSIKNRYCQKFITTQLKGILLLNRLCFEENVLCNLSNAFIDIERIK